MCRTRVLVVARSLSTVVHLADGWQLSTYTEALIDNASVKRPLEVANAESISNKVRDVVECGSYILSADIGACAGSGCECPLNRSPLLTRNVKHKAIAAGYLIRPICWIIAVILKPPGFRIFTPGHPCTMLPVISHLGPQVLPRAGTRIPSGLGYSDMTGICLGVACQVGVDACIAGPCIASVLRKISFDCFETSCSKN